MSNNEKKYCVYIHISPSEKRYIGITSTSVNQRWRNGKGYERNEYFTRAINKYGWDNFEHIIIARGLDKETAEWLEIELIREWDTTNPNNGYNISKGGKGSKGCEHTEEWKQQMSERMSGENNPMYGVHLCGENHSNWGKHHSEETKEKISEALKGKYCGENSHMFGVPKSEEHKQKNREAHLGIYDGKDNPNAKSVINLTTKRIFLTMKEGAEFYNTKNSYIGQCCNGKQKSAGKLADGTKLIWRRLNHNHNIILRGKDISKLHVKREVA